MADAFVNYLRQKLHPQQHSMDVTNLPHPHNYQELVQWLESEKQKGRDYYADAGNNRTKMCINISSIVGWDVDSTSLGKRINRNRNT